MTSTQTKPCTIDNDLVSPILEHLCDNYGVLYKCALVCKEFNVTASRLLYCRVVFSPPFRPVLNLKDRGRLTEPSQFTSACLPHYAPLVEELRISGFLSPRPPPLNTFSTTLLNAIRTFRRLRVACFTPKTYHEETFTQTLQTLIKDIPTLKDLAVNSSCMDAPRAPIITQIRGLKRLELHDLTRAILGLLPDWLNHLSATLKEMHLKDNCGSITPGVLKVLVPPLQQSNIRALSLGLSYSLTHDDTFQFLNKFPQLEELELRYYWQLRKPTVSVSLSWLRKFTVLHARSQVKREVLALCKWMRKVISSSPIEDLRVVCDRDNGTNNGANICFDSIIDHLSNKHAKTLRFLDLRSSFVGVTGLEALFSSCSHLEQFHVAAGRDALTTFERLYGDLKQLRLAGFELRNVNRSKCQIDRQRVRELMRNGPTDFRELIINGTSWKRFWTAESDGNVAFVVDTCTPVKFPWERV